MKIAFVFSGQGAQYVGMGQEIYENYPQAKQVFAEASAAIGYDMTKLCFFENDQLHLTEFTQPAILTVSTAIAKVLKEVFDIRPQAAAGLSLGEYSALVESGALSFSETVPLLQKRGKYMTEAVPLGEGAMSAIMGLDRALVEQKCQEASQFGIVQPANYNMPGQIAIAGTTKAVEKAEELLQKAGAKRVIRLNVSGPFHTPLLEPAAQKLALALEKVTVNPMRIPVVTNLTGKQIATKEMIRPTLVQQVKSPVYWEDSVRTMIEDGVDTFIEVGPGKTLTSFIRKISKEVTVQNVENRKTLEKTVAYLSEKRGESSC